MVCNFITKFIIPANNLYPASPAQGIPALVHLVLGGTGAHGVRVRVAAGVLVVGVDGVVVVGVDGVVGAVPVDGAQGILISDRRILVHELVDSYARHVYANISR